MKWTPKVGQKNFWGLLFMARHTLEEKLSIVFQIKKGIPIRAIALEHHMCSKMITEWLRKYDLYGKSGLQKGSIIRPGSELKEKIVRSILENSLPLPQVVLQYGISRSALESWIRQVKQDGYEVLYQHKKLGRPCKPMGRPKKRVPETELEKLQAENSRLKAENALLKKVRALVEEREARERVIGRRPSKN